MRAFNIVLAVAAILLVVVPLAIFVALLAVQGFTQAVAWATIYLLIWCVLLAIVSLLVLGALVVFGLPFLRRKTRSLLHFARSASIRVEGLASRVGGVAVVPLIRAHGLAAWVRGFARGLRTARRV